MEENLIFFAIGGLLFLTLLVNSVSEAYEQRQREKRIKILRIKQSLDELSNLLESLKNCNVGEDIHLLIANEIMARLQAIQSLDRNFRGIQALIEEAKAENKAPQENTVTDTKDETEFKKKMIKLGRLIRTLNTPGWFSRVTPGQLNKYINNIKLLRCEQIFQHYSELASQASSQSLYMAAKEHYYYISHALKNSGLSSHPRVSELSEQTKFMLDQTSNILSENTRKMMEENSAGTESEGAANNKPETEGTPDAEEKSQAEKADDNP